jgi:hypothetical protein
MPYHLSPIYAKLGVHIQVDVNRLIRRGEGRPTLGEGRPTLGTCTDVPFGQ